MTPAARFPDPPMCDERAASPEHASVVVARGEAASELPTSFDSAPEFVSVPRRALVLDEPAPESRVEEKTVIEPEEWIRARDQIALVVRSTIAEAILPLQRSIAAIAQRVDALPPAPKRRLRQIPPTPPRSTTPPPPAPSETSAPDALPPASALPAASQSALTRLGEIAAKLRREQGISISTLQLAALLLEHAAQEVDERVAAELARAAYDRD